MIETFIQYNLDHYIIYKLMEKFHCYDIMSRLNFSSMSDIYLKEIIEKNDQLSVAKMINHMLMQRLSRY